MPTMKTNEPIRFTCNAVIEAAAEENKPPTFSMTAYTGAAMELGFGRPVIVDLSGVKSAATIPIFRGHDSDKIVGHGSAEIKDSGITASGVISAENEHSRDVIASSKNGFPWQASIGAEIVKAEPIGEKDTATVNGRAVKGPAYIIRQSRLYEISFVPLGADNKTSASVAATKAEPKPRKGLKMVFQKWLEAKGFDADALSDEQTTSLQAMFDGEQKKKSEAVDPVEKPGDGFQATIARNRAERERVKGIEATATEFMNRYPMLTDDIEKMVEAAITDQSTEPKDFRMALLESTHAVKNLPATGRGNSCNTKVVEAAVCKTLRLDNIEKHFNEATLEAADKHFSHGLGLQELLVIAAEANGVRNVSKRNIHSLLEAAFPPRGSRIEAQGWSTFSLPGILSNVMNKTLLGYFMGATDSADPRVAQVWRNIAGIRPVSDFKTISQYALTGDMQYELLPPNGEIKHGTVGETTYTNKADTYAKMMAVDRRDIINDDLGALQRIPQKLGRGAALAIFDAFWAAFLNNAAFFVAGNNNVSTGAGSAFDNGGVGLTAAEVIFSAQTDPDGKPLGVSPQILLVPPTLLNNALRVMNSSLTVGGSTNVADVNVFGGRYRVYSSQYMENATYTGNSAAAWYLLANPMDLAAIDVVFLNGREAPVVERADADFNVLGIQVRGYHDFGVALQEPRAGVRSAGA